METTGRILSLLRQPIRLEQLPLFRSRLKVRPNLAGLGFFILCLCGLAMSINFSNNLIFAMTFLLVGIAIVAWWQTRANLLGLSTGRWRCSPVFAGQQAVYVLPVTNHSDIYRYDLFVRTGSTLKARDNFSSKSITMNPVERVRIKLRRQTAARGILGKKTAYLCSHYPLGIFTARMDVGQLPECLVYPEPVGHEPLPDDASGQMGNRRRESVSMTDLKRYSPGDPLSRIAWKVLARTDELYSREFDGAAGLPALWLRWDDVRAQGTEQKLSQLCKWVLQAHRQNREYGLEIPGSTIDIGKGEEHLTRCLSALALYGIDSSKSRTPDR